MLSAWKRFITSKQELSTNGSDANSVSGGIPNGVEKLNKNLQRKFRNGVSYNLRVPIIGDTRVGKTCLFHRLKGEGFVADYNPTEDLKVTSIDWNYRATNDIVKIDVWEVVETAVRRSPVSADLKIKNQVDHQFNDNRKVNNTSTGGQGLANGNPSAALPKPTFVKLSDSLDVYKGAHAVIAIFDMQKAWTYKYVQNEMSKIPKQLPTLVLANYRDMSHHRTVSGEQVTSFIQSLDRTSCDGLVMYTECSMKNGFGMKLVEKFFNIPFLRLQEENLLKQLELNRQETMTTVEELRIMQDISNDEYEKHLELDTIRRRQLADSMSPVNLGVTQIGETIREQIRTGAIASDRLDATSSLGNERVTSIESRNNGSNDKKTAAQLAAEAKFKDNRMPSIVFGANNPLPETKVIQMARKSSIPNSIFTRPERQIGSAATYVESEVAATVAKGGAKEDGDRGDDNESDDSDDADSDIANPMIANFGSELDSDDQSVAAAMPS